MMDSGREVTRGSLSQRTRAEHDALLLAIHRLESALASPAPGREREWAARVARDLAPVEEALRVHAHSAESSDGLFAELELAQPGVSRRLQELHDDHQRLLAMSAALCRALDRGAQLPDYAALRTQAAELHDALRRHHALEVDLIFEVFWTDIGVGD